MPPDRLQNAWLRLTLVVLVLLVTGCGGGPTGPGGPNPPDLSTPEGAIQAQEDFYSYRMYDEALALLAPGYTFHPARPESIPFLAPGETSWDRDRESTILGLLLVEERTSWIDQVLLDIKKERRRELSPTRIEIDADVQLSLLVGVDLFERSRSKITLLFERNAEGDYLLLDERESLAINPDTNEPFTELTVGEQKARVLEGP